MLSATVGGSSEGGDEPVVGADGTFANPYELGETNAVDFPGGMDYVFYAYTATAAGTLTINITTTDYYWAYGFDEYSLTTVGGYNPTADIAIAAGQTVYVGLSTYSCNAKAITFTSSFVASGEDVGGGETSEPDGTFANPYELGETNALDYAGGNNYVFYVYTAPAAGTLTINVTSDDFYWAYGAGEYALENVGNVASAGITLAAGETVYIGMSSYSYGAAIITFTATFSEGGSSEGGDEGGEDVGGGEVGGGETSDLAGSGTSADPWVLVTLPYSATHGAGHDVYYSYTATEAVTIVISYPAGSVISGLPSSYVKDEAAMTYTFSLAAGETVIINPWTTGVLEAYNYTFAIGEPTTDEGGEDVGGGESAAVTYIGSTTSNNRKMMVVIDAAAGTMTVTRSDMTGNFTGGATTANFTYSFADGVVTYEVVGSSSVTAMTFDENGAPLTVTWMGVVYEGYELQ